MNNISLVGRLTKEPELSYTPQNLAVATFSLTVNRQAENLANWANKGALIAISGRIQTRNYENQ